LFRKAFLDLSRAWALRPVWLYHAYHEISAKYKRTVLGSIWITGSIVATSLALSIVMGGLFGQTVQESLPYIMAGIMTFGLGSFILNDAPETFLSAAGMIKNHANPFMYYVFEHMSRVYLTFLHNVIAYLILAAVLGAIRVPHWSLPLGFLAVFVTVAAWSPVTAICAARFRDLRYLLPFSANIVYFVSPVFWHPEQLTGWRTMFYKFNPFFGMMEVVRSPLMGHEAPVIAWELTLGFGALGIIMWVIVFSLNRNKIAFWV